MKIIKKDTLTSLEIRITEQFGKIIQKFPILHHGWEQDDWGYIVWPNDGSDNKLVLTNHSKPYEANASELRQKIIEYQKAIGETNEALKLLV